MEGSAPLAEMPLSMARLIGEPTSLLLYAWTTGSTRFLIVAVACAAHTSRADLGVNAVAAAAQRSSSIEDQLFLRPCARRTAAGPCS